MTKRTGSLWLLVAVAGLAFSACNKTAVDKLSSEDSRIYITDYDSTKNFSSYTTYSVSDSVTFIDNQQAVKQLTESDKAYVDAVKKYMSAKGYTLVDKAANPDLGVDVSRIINTTTGVVSYPDYYGGYGSYWDPYYWGYGGYGYYSPYSYGVYSITEGAVSVDMLDLKNAASSNRIDLIWSGLIRGQGLSNSASADSQVKALFDQSPYLTNNN